MPDKGQIPGRRPGENAKSTEDTAASTQMFRAFVDQPGEQAGAPKNRVALILASGGLLVAALAVIVVLFTV